MIPIATDLLSFLASVLTVADGPQPIPFAPAVASAVLCDGQLIKNDA